MTTSSRSRADGRHQQGVVWTAMDEHAAGQARLAVLGAGDACGFHPTIAGLIDRTADVPVTSATSVS